MLKQGNKTILPNDEFANLDTIEFDPKMANAYLKEIVENGTPSK